MANSVFVAAEEDEDGIAGNWTVRAIAICAATSVRAVGASATDSLNKSATDNCGTGRQVTGGGFDMLGDPGQELVPELVPSASTFAANRSRTRTASRATGASGHGRSACRPWPARRIVSATSPDDSLNKSVAVACPSGKAVLGTGATVIGAPAQIILDGIVPDPALTGVIANAVEDETGTGGNWELRVFAICATPPPGLELVTVAAEDPDSDPSSVTATCPAGRRTCSARGRRSSAPTARWRSTT